VGRLPKVARPRNLGLDDSIPLGLGNGLWRDAGNGHRDGRAPQQCPSWWPCASTGQWQFAVDERGNGHGAEYPKGISSISPALTRSGYAG